MENHPTIIFVCEHGAAKSVIAAAYFNRFAAQTGSDLRAMARGTNPDKELSPQAIQVLKEVGLTPTESFPQGLTAEEIQSAQRVVAFCDLPAEYHQAMVIEHWNDIPAVSENYEKARDAIIERIHQMLSK